MPRLFVAAWPSAAVVDALRRLPRSDEPGVRWVPDANWHVTLRFVGDADVDAVHGRLADATLPRALVALGPRVERLGPRQLVVPAEGADRLAEAVRTATAGIGVLDDRPFRGHLTIARTTPRASSRTAGASFEASFPVERVALVTSELRPDGAVYVTLAEYPTQG